MPSFTEIAAARGHESARTYLARLAQEPPYFQPSSQRDQDKAKAIVSFRDANLYDFLREARGFIGEEDGYDFMGGTSLDFDRYHPETNDPHGEPSDEIFVAQLGFGIHSLRVLLNSTKQSVFVKGEEWRGEVSFYVSDLELGKPIVVDEYLQQMQADQEA